MVKPKKAKSNNSSAEKMLLPSFSDEDEDKSPLILGNQEEDEQDIDNANYDHLVEKITGKKNKRKWFHDQDLEFEEGKANDEKNADTEFLDTLKEIPAFREPAHIQKKTKKHLEEVPLPKHEAAKFKKQDTYEKNVEELSEWDDVVKANKEAPQLVFPLVQPDTRIKPASEFFASRPEGLKSSLELKVEAILNKSQNIGDSAPEAPEDPELLAALDLEESKRRHRDMQKARFLISVANQKAKYKKSQKGRRNRKFEKKKKLKEKEKELEQLMATNPEEAKKKLQEEADRQRIEERISLKHKNTGKWAVRQKLRAKFDPEAREAINEQLQIAQRLTQKAAFAGSGSESDDDNEAQTEQTPTTGHEFNKDFFGPQTVEEPLVVDSEFIRHLRGNKRDERPKNEEKALAFLDNYLEQQKKKEAGKEKEAPTEDNSASLPEKLVADSEVMPESQPGISLDDDEEEMDEEPSKIKRPLMQVFGDADLCTEEFRQEKKQAEENAKPKDLDLFLPGWGNWTGPGCQESSQKKKRFLFKAPKMPPRKDRALPHVIINENATKDALRKHQVSELPFPFKSVSQYESSVRHPIGREWCTESSFLEQIAPSVVTRRGAVINPIDAGVLKEKKDKER